MFDTDDYLKLPPWEALITMINETYQLALNPLTARLVNLEATGLLDTRITVANDRSRRLFNLLPAFKQQTFRYRRLDLEEVLGQDREWIFEDILLPATTLDIVQRISQATGIVFDDNDFIHFPVDNYDTARQLTLRAHPRSLRWVGSLSISIRRVARPLSELARQTTLDVIRYPSQDLTRLQGPLYLMAEDFTPHHAVLSRVRLDDFVVSGNDLVSVIRQVVPERWVCSFTNQPWNLMTQYDDVGLPQYTALYNGVVDPKWTPRRDIANVLVLQLSDRYCRNVGGNLLLHYN